ncbi:hypothetical protein GCM10017562_73700 [Streptomyces roseofulvus]
MGGGCGLGRDPGDGYGRRPLSGGPGLPPVADLGPGGGLADIVPWVRHLLLDGRRANGRTLFLNGGRTTR